MKQNNDAAMLRDHKRRMAKINRKNKEAKYREEERKAAGKFKKKRGIATSKVALFVMMAICFEIIIFAEVSMYKLGDLSSIATLIGIPASMALVIWGYYSKSKAENTANGIVYETALREIEMETETEDESVG